MTEFQYPKGMIPMTGGFRKNDPTDTYPMGVAKDLFGGFKVESTIDDMLALHPNYLLVGYTACLVLQGVGGGVELYYLDNVPSNSDSTVIGDWKQSELGGNVDGALTYKGFFNPSSYTISDSSAGNEVGDLYIVNITTTATEVIISDPDLFGGTNVTVKSTDWIVFNGTVFEHIEQDVTSITWDTLAGKPEILSDYINGILPSHKHPGTDVEVNKQIDSTLYTYLNELLGVIVYTNTIAASVLDAQPTQLLTLSQLEEKFVTHDYLSTNINELISTELAKYYTKTEVNTLLNTKQDSLTDADIKTKLEANPDTNTLTDAEKTKLQSLSATSTPAKIILSEVTARDGGIVHTINQSDIPGESYITEFSSTGSVVRCVFRFSTMDSLYGAFEVNGMPFDSVERVGDSEIFEGTIDVDITGLTNIVVTGDTNLSIPVADTPNMISSIALPTLTAPKTHYYKGEVINLTLNVDDGVDAIQITNGQGINNKAKFPVTTTNGICNINVTVSHEGGPGIATCVVTPYKVDTLGKSFVLSDIPVDNTLPTIESTLTYLSGYSALKDADIVNINLTGTNYGEIIVSNVDNIYLQTDTVTLSKVTLYRVGGNDVTTPVEITAINTSNQRSTVISQDVVIYNILPVILTSIQEVRSGQTELVDLVTDPSKLHQVTTPATTAGIVTANSPTVEFYADDSVPHDGTDITISYNYTTIAGNSSTGTRPVNIVGFAERSVTLDHPKFELTLPFDIRGIYGLKISAIIQSTPTFEIEEFVKDGADANGYSVINNNTIQFKRELEAFGYNSSNPMSVNISE